MSSAHAVLIETGHMTLRSHDAEATSDEGVSSSSALDSYDGVFRLIRFI